MVSPLELSYNYLMLLFMVPVSLFIRLRDNLFASAKQLRLFIDTQVQWVSGFITNTRIWQEKVAYPPSLKPVEKETVLHKEETLQMEGTSTVSYTDCPVPAVATLALHLDSLEWSDDVVKSSTSPLKTYIVIRHLDCFEAKSSIQIGQFQKWNREYRVTVPIHDVSSDVSLLFYSVNRVSADTLLGFVTIPLTSLHKRAVTDLRLTSGEAIARTTPCFTRSQVFPATGLSSTVQVPRYHEALRPNEGVPKPSCPLGWLSFESALVLQSDSLWEAYGSKYLGSGMHGDSDNIQRITHSLERLKRAVIRIAGEASPIRKSLHGIRTWQSPAISVAFLLLYFHVCFTATLPQIPFIVFAFVALVGSVDSCELRREYTVWKQGNQPESVATVRSVNNQTQTVITASSRLLANTALISMTRVRNMLPQAGMFTNQLIGVVVTVASTVILTTQGLLASIECRLPLVRKVTAFGKTLPLMHHVIRYAPLSKLNRNSTGTNGQQIDSENETLTQKSNLKRRGSASPKKNVRFRIESGSVGYKEVRPGSDDDQSIGSARLGKETQSGPSLSIIQQAMKTKQQLDGVEGFLSTSASRLEQALNIWNGSDPNVTITAYAVLLVFACTASLALAVIQFVFLNIVSPGTLCFTLGTTYILAGASSTDKHNYTAKAFTSGAQLQVGHDAMTPSFLYVFCVAVEALVEIVTIGPGEKRFEQIRNTLSRCPDESDRAHREISKSLEDASYSARVVPSSIG